MVETLWQNEECALGLIDGVFVCVWVGNPTVRAADEIERCFKEHGPRFSKGAGLITIVLANAPPPESAARKRIAEILSNSQNLKASAVCFEGSGLRATIVRTVVTGINLMARLAFPHKVFATFESGVAFVHGTLSQASIAMPEAKTLVTAISAWRATLTR